MSPRLLPRLAFIALLLHTPAANAISPTAEAGVGLPELIHLRLGAYVHPRVSVELYSSNVIFNWLVGAGATAYWLGEHQGDRPPKHALMTRLSLALNPVGEITLEGGGERIGAAAFVTAGYALTARSGFLLRAGAGALLYEDGGFAGGPNLTFSIGWVF